MVSSGLVGGICLRKTFLLLIAGMIVLLLLALSFLAYTSCLVGSYLQSSLESL